MGELRSGWPVGRAGARTRPLDSCATPCLCALAGRPRIVIPPELKLALTWDSSNQSDTAVSEQPSGARVRGRSTAVRGGPWGGNCSQPGPALAGRGLPGCDTPAAPGCGPDPGLSKSLDHLLEKPPAVGGGGETVQEQRSGQKRLKYRMVEALHLSLVSVLQLQFPLIMH